MAKKASGLPAGHHWEQERLEGKRHQVGIKEPFVEKSSGHPRFILMKNTANFKAKCYCSFWAITPALQAHPYLVIQVTALDLVSSLKVSTRQQCCFFKNK